MKTMVINGGSDEKGTTDVLDFFKIHAEHQLLKYAAGHQMFCPVQGCGVILDYKKTVLVELINGPSLTVCLKCFNSDRVQDALILNKVAIKEVTKFRKA